MLVLFNTMKDAKEPFVSRVPRRVTMFVCGPTVQSRIHLGHARTYIFYDSLARYLRHLGYEVFFLMNVTDIDDSIWEAARRSGEDPLEYSKRMTAKFVADLGRLKIMTVSRFEPVSNHVEDMRRQMAALLRKKFAYRAGDWTYFDVSKFKAWGRLSHQSKRELSLRPLELSPKKRNLTDFALWRPEGANSGDWRSPWGPGSPGWHLQDTSVTLPIIGPQYDIHGGASELVYPHHEAQIALAESVTGVRPLVRYWVHTNLVNMKGRKMSKSVGNVVTVEDALKQYSADELRFFFLSVHHRREMGLAGIDSARRRLREMRRVAGRFEVVDVDRSELIPFEDALNDDFDSPRALRWSERQLRAATKETDRAKAMKLASSAASAMRILGVDLVGRT
jgi:cysteinyl-tRNA synthetase